MTLFCSKVILLKEIQLDPKLSTDKLNVSEKYHNTLTAECLYLQNAAIYIALHYF